MHKLHLITNSACIVLLIDRFYSASTTPWWQINLDVEVYKILKGMEHVPNIFMSFDKYIFLEVLNILI